MSDPSTDVAASQLCGSPSDATMPLLPSHADNSEEPPSLPSPAPAPVVPSTIVVAPALVVEDEDDADAASAPAAPAAPPAPAVPAPRARLPAALRVLLACALIHALSVGSISVLVPKMELELFDDNASYAARIDSILNPVAGVFGLFASLSLSALADTYGRKFFLVVSLVANGVALLIVGVSYSLFGLVSLRILPAIFDVSGSVTYAVVSDMVPPETFVGVYTYFGAAFGGGLLLGPVVALGALAIEARHLPFLVCAICTLINLAFLMHRLPETLRWRERVQNAKDDMDEENAVEAAAAVAAAAPDLPAAASAPSAPSPLESQPIAGAKSNPFDFPASPSPPAAAAAPPAVASKLESSDLLVAPIPFVPSQPRDWRSVLRVAAVNPFATLKMAWSTRVLARLCSSLFLHTLGDGFLVAVIFLYGKEMWNWGATENAGLVVYGGISSMVVMVWVAPRMQKRWGEKRTMHISQAAAILQLIVVALSPIGWIVYPVATIGAANFLWTPALRAQISRQVGPEAQGALQGAVATVVSTASILSSAMGSALFSVLADHDGPLYWPGLTFLVAAFFNVLAVLVVVGVDTRGIAKIDVDTPRKGQEANKQADTEAERAHSAHLIQSPLRRSNSLLNEIEETRYGEWVE